MVCDVVERREADVFFFFGGGGKAELGRMGSMMVRRHHVRVHGAQA